MTFPLTRWIIALYWKWPFWPDSSYKEIGWFWSLLYRIGDLMWLTLLPAVLGVTNILPYAAQRLLPPMAWIGVVGIFAPRRLVLPESVLHVTRHVLERTHGHIWLRRDYLWLLYHVWATCVDVLESHNFLVISKVVFSILKRNVVWKFWIIALNHIFYILAIWFWVLDNEAVVLFLCVGKSPLLETHPVVLCLICRCRLFSSCMACISLALSFLRIFDAISTESVHALPLPCFL